MYMQASATGLHPTLSHPNIQDIQGLAAAAANQSQQQMMNQQLLAAGNQQLLGAGQGLMGSQGQQQQLLTGDYTYNLYNTNG